LEGPLLSVLNIANTLPWDQQGELDKKQTKTTTTTYIDDQL